MPASGKNSRYIIKFSLLLILLLVVLEIFLRLVLGLGNPPLFEASPDYGYRFVPNQDIRRFGKRIYFNSQGLRSEQVAIRPANGTMRILCIGDSITYGGALTDQRDTYPYKLEEMLNEKGQLHYEVVSASAPGWSIENIEAYLRRYGIHNSRIVILQLSETDLYQEKVGSEVVGLLPDFPDKKPGFALEELLIKYIPRYLPVFKRREMIEYNPLPKEEILNRNLQSLRNISEFINAGGGDLIVLYIGHSYNFKCDSAAATYAKEKFIRELTELNLPLIDLGGIFTMQANTRLFRDDIHPNEKGNGLIAKFVSKEILKLRD